jgi:hypothetical protein
METQVLLMGGFWTTGAALIKSMGMLRPAVLVALGGSATAEDVLTVTDEGRTESENGTAGVAVTMDTLARMPRIVTMLRSIFVEGL